MHFRYEGLFLVVALAGCATKAHIEVEWLGDSRESPAWACYEKTPGKLVCMELQAAVMAAIAKMSPEDMDSLLLRAKEAYDGHGEAKP